MGSLLASYDVCCASGENNMQGHVQELVVEQ